MSHLASNFPTPSIEREAFAGGFAASGTALLTFDDLQNYDPGRGSGAEKLFKCPFCGATERAFHVNTETGRFNCKRSSCDVKGILREFWNDARGVVKPSGRARTQNRLRTAFGLSPSASPLLLPSSVPLSTPKSADSVVAADSVARGLDTDSVSVPDASSSDASNWSALWENALGLENPGAQLGRDYLQRRGACLESAMRAGSRFCSNWAPSPSGKSYHGGAAVLFPLRDFDGQLQAVSGRYLRPDASPKARTGGALGAGAFWAPPHDGFQWRGADTLALVEGPFDALALAACSVAALALNGTNLPHWFARIVAFKAVRLGADADVAGETAALKWTDQISVYTRRVSRLRPPIGCKDFGQALSVHGREWLMAWLEGEPLRVFESDPKPLLFDPLSDDVTVSDPLPFAPLAVLQEANARGMATTPFGWPVAFCPSDYTEI